MGVKKIKKLRMKQDTDLRDLHLKMEKMKMENENSMSAMNVLFCFIFCLAFLNENKKQNIFYKQNHNCSKTKQLINQIINIQKQLLINLF